MPDIKQIAEEKQQRVIGTLPAGSVIHELPMFSRYLVLHPTEPPKIITMSGLLVTIPEIQR